MSVKSFDGSSCLNKKRETYRQSGYVLSLEVQSYPPPPQRETVDAFYTFFRSTLRESTKATGRKYSRTSAF